jgi:hypothetical protein
MASTLKHTFHWVDGEHIEIKDGVPTAVGTPREEDCYFIFTQAANVLFSRHTGKNAAALIIKEAAPAFYEGKEEMDVAAAVVTVLGPDIFSALAAASFIDITESKAVQSEASYQAFLAKPFADVIENDLPFVFEMIGTLFSSIFDEAKKAQAEGKAPHDTLPQKP